VFGSSVNFDLGAGGVERGLGFFQILVLARSHEEAGLEAVLANLEHVLHGVIPEQELG